MTTSLAFFLFATPSGMSGFPLLLLVAMFAMLYLLMIRPQQKRQKQWQSMLANIKTGDRVTTAGGIRGTILSLKDDTVIIRVAPDNLKLEIAKSAIASVTTRKPDGHPAQALVPQLQSFRQEKRNHEEESQEQSCADHCGPGGLPLRHLRHPVGLSGKALLEAMSKRIHLGLDLQGGAHLILQVQVLEAVNAETDNSVQTAPAGSEEGQPGLFPGVSSPIRSGKIRPRRRHRQAGGDPHRGHLAGAIDRREQTAPVATSTPTNTTFPAAPTTSGR